jgi:beta-lactamase class A
VSTTIARVVEGGVAELAAPALARFVSALPERGCFSLWAGPVRGDAVAFHNADAEHYAASTMKVPLVVAVYREDDQRRLDLDAPVLVHNSFESAADGSAYSIDRTDDSDPQVWRREGEEVSVRWLCHRALVCSSNLATNLLLDVVSTDAVQRVLADAGARHSCVRRGIEDAAARHAGLQNIVTAADLAKVLQRLATGTLASPDACAEVVSVLAAQQINDAIPAGLPRGTWVAHKSGWVDGVSHDAALIRPPDAAPFVLVMCTTSNLTEQDGLELIATGAAAAWEDRRVLG